MAHPFVFISHFTIKPGRLDDLKLLTEEVVTRLEVEKPQTPIYLIYLDDNGTEVTFVHVFADGEGMDLHFGGAQERSRVAFEFMDPQGWEIYGRPSDASLETVRRGAASAEVPLTIQPDYLAGFMRLVSTAE